MGEYFPKILRHLHEKQINHYGLDGLITEFWLSWSPREDLVLLKLLDYSKRNGKKIYKFFSEALKLFESLQWFLCKSLISIIFHSVKS